jgi:hypothetical protein
MKPPTLAILNDDGIRTLAATVVACATDEYRALEAKGLVRDGKPTKLAHRVLRYTTSINGHNTHKRVSNQVHIGTNGIVELVHVLKSRSLDFYLCAAGFDHTGTAVRRSLHLHA